MALPTLYIKAEGSIAVRDNLKQFGIEMNAYIAKIPKEPSTDQEFADAKKSVGILKTAEDELRAAKDSVLAQITTVGDMSRMADLLIETASTTRLMVDKLVKAREKSVKLEKLNASKVELAKHIAGLETEIKPITIGGMVAHPDWDTATKNKRTLTSLQSALNDEVAKQKINADALAKKVRENLSWCKEHAAGKGSLFPDLQQIVFNEHDHFILIIKERIAKAEQEEAARIEAMRIEEQAKAEAKVRAEIAEKERIAAEALKQPETAPEVVTAPKTTPGAVSAKEAPEYIKGGASTTKDIHPMHGSTNRGDKVPQREKLVEAIALAFGVDDSIAELWAVKRFGA